MNVKPYEKLYLNVIPGSCPPNRPKQGDDEIAYQQKFGKGPLIERAERIRRLQQIQNQMKVEHEPHHASAQYEINQDKTNEMYLQMLKQERLKRVRRQMQQAGEDIIGNKNDHKNYKQELPMSVNRLQQDYNKQSNQYQIHQVTKPEISAQNRVGYLSSAVEDVQRPPRHQLNKENSQL